MDWVRIGPQLASGMAEVVRAYNRDGSGSPEFMRQRDRNELAGGIVFQNNSGEVVPGYGVMEVTGVTRSQNRLIRTIDKPGSTLKLAYLINGPRDIAIGKRGTGYLFGEALFTSGDGTPAVGEMWGPGVNTWELKKGFPGYPVEGSEGDTCLVQPFGVHIVHGILDGALSVGSTQTLSVRVGGTTTDTGKNITVRDNVMEAGQSITSGALVHAALEGGFWYAILADECPA